MPRELPLPTNLKELSYFTIDYEFGIYTIRLPDGRQYDVDVTDEDGMGRNGLYQYMLRQFDDEEFAEDIVSRSYSLGICAVYPQLKWVVHLR